MFEIKIRERFSAKQGLKPPVRAGKGLPSLVPNDGFDIALTIGITFDESRLTPQGWFVDTDAIEDHIKELSKHLQSDTWTSLFDFRPTFELVAQWSCNYLLEKIPQLAYVELSNRTINVSTRYSRS